MIHLKTFESYEAPMSREEMISHLCNSGWEKHELEDKQEEELEAMCKEVPSEMSEAKKDKWIADAIKRPGALRRKLHKGTIQYKLIQMERHIPSFDEFINESEVNELLKVDLKKLNGFVAKVANKIKDSNLISDVKTFIAMNQVDPYQNYTHILKDMQIRFRDNRPLLQLIYNELK